MTKNWLYFFNVIIALSVAFIIYHTYLGNYVAVVIHIFIMGVQIFIRAMLKADLDEDEERSKQHGGT